MGAAITAVGVPAIHRCAALMRTQVGVSPPTRIERDTIDTIGDNQWWIFTTNSNGHVVTSCPYCLVVLPSVP